MGVSILFPDQDDYLFVPELEPAWFKLLALCVNQCRMRDGLELSTGWT
jgi:hypothetical protein